MSFGIAFKPKELGSEPPSSCMDYAGSRPVIMIALIGNKPFWGRGFLRSPPRK
jgi:hypothetical protein